LLLWCVILSGRGRKRKSRENSDIPAARTVLRTGEGRLRGMPARFQKICTTQTRSPPGAPLPKVPPPGGSQTQGRPPEGQPPGAPSLGNPPLDGPWSVWASGVMSGCPVREGGAEPVTDPVSSSSRNEFIETTLCACAEESGARKGAVHGVAEAPV
jgi:hypothetical protein